jgi:hypothetical protein
MINLRIAESLGPITKEENPQAQINHSEAMKFLAEPPPESQAQKMDIDDLVCCKIHCLAQKSTNFFPKISA